MNKEEKEVVNMIKTGLEVSVEGQIIEQIHISRKEAKALLNLIQKQDKIIDYSIDRILPSPEEYLEIKNIMKQNKWGYDRSKKEYFKKEVEKDVKD